MPKYQIPESVQETILKIVDGGNAAEVKIERDNLVVVEISRRVRIKHPKTNEE